MACYHPHYRLVHRQPCRQGRFVSFAGKIQDLAQLTEGKCSV